MDLGIFFSRRKQEEVVLLEEKIRQRSEQQKKAGVELDATCHICLKTKFADGVGHLCNYCGIRCCARCGGKVTLRSSKVSTYSVVGIPKRIIWTKKKKKIDLICTKIVKKKNCASSTNSFRILFYSYVQERAWCFYTVIMTQVTIRFKGFILNISSLKLKF